MAKNEPPPPPPYTPWQFFQQPQSGYQGFRPPTATGSPAFLNYQFLGQNPGPAGFLQSILNNTLYNSSRFDKLSNSALNTGHAGALALGGAVPFTAPVAYSNLADILLGQGRTDPRMMNQQLAGISRSTQQNQDNIRGELARMGLGTSGVGMALQSAAGLSGQQQRSQLEAAEAQRAEERKRNDLDLFLRVIGQPAQDYGALGLGQYNANAQRGQQQNSAQLAALGSILGGLASCWVAAELYGGWFEPRTVRARHWLWTEAPAAFRRFYLAHGPAWAEAIRNDPAEREATHAIFDLISE